MKDQWRLGYWFNDQNRSSSNNEYGEGNLTLQRPLRYWYNILANKVIDETLVVVK